MAILKSGGDTLDAALAVVTKVEDDPNDDSVGYGGLPNEDGVVELDASVMHGPTRRAGAVASVQKIKNPSLVAKAVMEKTNHVFIVGSGALQFAVDEGFVPMNLLTDRSRLAWLAWKAQSSENWRPGLDSPEWKAKLATLLDTPERMAWREHIEDVVAHPRTGTINCLAVNSKGEISGTTTTSGLSWKIAGRVGDSPVIGAGLFVDGEIGGAGSTGRGEENIKISGGHTIVEMMRRGAAIAQMEEMVGNQMSIPPGMENDAVKPVVQGVTATNANSVSTNRTLSTSSGITSLPGKVNVGSPSAGTPPYLAVELLKMMAGISIVHVPYVGESQMVTDLLGGQLMDRFDPFKVLAYGFVVAAGAMLLLTLVDGTMSAPLVLAIMLVYGICGGAMALAPMPRGFTSRRLLSGNNAPGSWPWISAAK